MQFGEHDSAQSILLLAWLFAHLHTSLKYSLHNFYPTCCLMHCSFDLNDTKMLMTFFICLLSMHISVEILCSICEVKTF